MRAKSLYIITLFQIAVLCGWAQNVDVFMGENSENGGVTMIVDTDISSGKSSGENLDSIKQFNEKWESYWSEKNKEMEQLSIAVQEIDTINATKEIIADYTIHLENLKNEVDFKLGKDDLWKDNDKLDKMRNSFFATHNRTSVKLQQWGEILSQKKDPPNKLLIIGICLLSIMAGVPIFTQIKSSVVVKKAKKMQEKLAKLQQEEAEKQRLLADKSNEITLKE